MPKFAISAPGSLASQRIKQLERRGAELELEIEELRKKLERAKIAPDEELPPPQPEFPFHGHHNQRNRKHPVARMSNLKCSFPPCGQYGHNENNCQLRIKNDLEKIATECENGWHKPHLHDSMCKWRCQWCKLHLHEDYVRATYPTEFERERAKEQANHEKLIKKYTSRTCISL